jgi:hypothetical protein
MDPYANIPGCNETECLNRYLELHLSHFQYPKMLADGSGGRREAGTGIEPVNSGFADRGLTTWLPRRIGPLKSKYAGYPLFKIPASIANFQERCHQSPKLGVRGQYPNDGNRANHYCRDGRKVNGKQKVSTRGRDSKHEQRCSHARCLS